MAAPDIDKLQAENENFIVEQEKPALQTEHEDVDNEPIVKQVAKQKKETVTDLDFTLDDITASPPEKTREEIIAEAEAAAFAEGS